MDVRYRFCGEAQSNFYDPFQRDYKEILLDLQEEGHIFFFLKLKKIFLEERWI